MRIREAHEHDAAALAQVLVTAYRAAHRDYLPPEYLRALTYEESARNWARTLRAIDRDPAARERVFAAEDGEGQVVGVAMGGPLRAHPVTARDDPATTGELYVLYILPAWHRRGVGRLLVAAVACGLAGRGMETMRVWVLRDNRPARQFYAALGGILAGERAREDEGILLTEVLYGWDRLDDLMRIAPPEGTTKRTEREDPR